MADSSFGLKIGLEGEREFKRAITDINREMRVLGSEMKLVASSSDKNAQSAESLTARNQVLGKEIEAQKTKIETLRAALENSASSFGENDSRTKNWQIQLNSAGAELNKLEGELKANNDALLGLDQVFLGAHSNPPAPGAVSTRAVVHYSYLLALIAPQAAATRLPFQGITGDCEGRFFLYLEDALDGGPHEG